MFKRGFFVFFLVLLSLLTSVAAPPPSFTEININTQQGLQLFFPIDGTLKQDSDFTFFVHATNISDGMVVSPDDLSCHAHLYDDQGNELYDGAMTKSGHQMTVTIDGGNFSKLGYHHIFAHCNTSTIGGSAIEAFLVTKNGTYLETAYSLVYFILAFGVLVFFLLSLYFAITLPYRNRYNNEGVAIKITKLKYVKLGAIMLSYSLFTWWLNILIGLSSNYAELTMYFGFFSFMFGVLNRLALPFGLFILILGGAEIIKDIDVYKKLKEMTRLR